MHRVLVIGAGSIGRRHVRCLNRAARAEVGLCEPDPARRRETAEGEGVVETFADVDEALTAGWDAAVIATPAPTHIPIAHQVVGAGLHVLIEKPLAVEETGVAELVQSVRERGVTAGVAYVHRAHPALAAMREAIRAGRLGKPVQLVVTAGQDFAYHRPAYREIYYADRARGGGAIQDGLTHLFNSSEWLVGPITRLLAQAEHRVLAGVEVEDTVHMMARHGQVMGSYAYNQYQAPNQTLLRVVCEQGTAEWLLQRHLWRWMTEPGGQWREEPASVHERDDLFILQARAFLDAIESGKPPLCPLEEGWQTLRVNRAALASADAGGQWQKIVES